MIFASFAHSNECVVCAHVRNVSDFPQDKLESEINARFLLNEHGNLFFYSIIIEYILSSSMKKKLKKFIGRKKDIGERVQKSVSLECKL